MMQSLTDEQVLDTYSETEDARYLNELVSRYVGKVRAMIYPMVQSHADADDLTQDVLVRVARNAKGFRQDSKVSTWIYAIAANTTRSFLKRSCRKQIEFRAESPERADNRPDPSAHIENKEINAAVSRAIAALPDNLRMAITLTVISGLSAKEAAHAEGCLTATMYWRIHEARKLLRQQLGGVRT